MGPGAIRWSTSPGACCSSLVTSCMQWGPTKTPPPRTGESSLVILCTALGLHKVPFLFAFAVLGFRGVGLWAVPFSSCRGATGAWNLPRRQVAAIRIAGAFHRFASCEKEFAGQRCCWQQRLNGHALVLSCSRAYCRPWCQLPARFCSENPYPD